MLYTWFAEVLEYPDERLVDRLDDWSKVAGGAHADADECVARFRRAVERLGPALVQEAYTSAFDLDLACTPYVGHHLFGEHVRRSLFMARLASEYRRVAPGAAGGDLPDRLPAMLRYLDANITDMERREAIEEAILPAVRRVTQALADRGHPYAALLRALLVVLDAQLRQAEQVAFASPQATGGGEV